MIAALGTLLIYGASLVVPFLNEWPAAYRFNPAPIMNEALSNFVTTFSTQIEMVKTAAFYFVMLPAKIGLQGAVSPFTWGFALTSVHQLAYAVGMAGVALWLARRHGPSAGVTVLIFAVIVYFGLTGLPWPALILILALLGYGIGGVAMAIGTTLGLLFIVVTGNWPAAVLWIYLCGIAMLVIAALVGASGLEQTVYIALTNGNVGQGLIAGLGLAIIAIIGDRMTSEWSRKRQASLGLERK